MPLIEPGQPAPDFTLRDASGRRRSLSDFAGRAVVLYFYPKNDTAGCTAQACAFRDGFPDFRKARAAVLGVSPDRPESHRAFAARHDLPFTLLADPPAADGAAPTVCDFYGAWGPKSMYGRTFMGVIRTTYLIDAAGIVRRRWDRVRVPGHARQVLAAVRALLTPPPAAAAATPARAGRRKPTPRTGRPAPRV